jgi:hypothetical protein
MDRLLSSLVVRPGISSPPEASPEVDAGSFRPGDLRLLVKNDCRGLSSYELLLFSGRELDGGCGNVPDRSIGSRGRDTIGGAGR